MKDNIIGFAIFRLRTENNMHQKKLGEILGFNQNTISDWERGRTEPSLDVVKELSKIFDVSYEELLEG